jgi:hypothetical protein
MRTTDGGGVPPTLWVIRFGRRGPILRLSGASGEPPIPDDRAAAARMIGLCQRRLPGVRKTCIKAVVAEQAP